MEDWQCEAIQRRKVKLLKLTRCNEILLAILVASNILTDEEKDEIGSEKVQVQKAAKLYDILPSRKNAYETLLRASKETFQSGVVKILEEAEYDHQFSTALKECVKKEFLYQSINPLFLTSKLNFECVRQAVANYVKLEILKVVFNVKKEMRPWLFRGPVDETLLHISVAYGYIGMIEYLISLGVDLNSKDILGRSPWHYIGKFSTNIIETTQIFLKHGSHLRQCEKDGLTMANTVAKYGTINQFHYHHWAEFMTTNGFIDLFALKCKAGCTPLHHLMKTFDMETKTIEMILKGTGMRINEQDKQGRTILHWALLKDRSVNLIKNLINFGADYKMRDKNKEGAVDFAVRGGNKESVSLLMSLIPDNNVANELGASGISHSSSEYQDENLPKNVPNDDIFEQDSGYVSKRDSKDSKINLSPPDNKESTSLHRALADGASLIVIKNLIDQEANYQLKDDNKKGALHFAVVGGNEEVISFLLSLKLDVNEVDEFGETPLHKARFTKSQDYLGMTTLLMDKGADLCPKDKYGRNVAHLFAYTEIVSSEHFQIWVKGMIDYGHGNIFAIPGQHGRTPIQTAMQRLDLDLATVKLMLEPSKLDIDHQDYSGYTLLDLALRFGRSLETLKNLVSLGAEIKMKDIYGSGVLHLAVEGGNKEVIQYLISKGLDVNQKNNYGRAPLHFVSRTMAKNYVELTKLLLDSSADLYSKNKYGNTLAHRMAFVETVSCDDFKIWATAMIESGHAHLFTIRGGDYDKTPLHLAMQRHDLDLETIKLIVESAKLDIDQPDNDGNTILHLALSSGRNFNTIRNLVVLGADWKKKGEFNRSVLTYAVVGSNKEAFLYFKSLGADVNGRDYSSRTPLHEVPWTRSKDYLGMTTFLLENGAKLSAKDRDGKTIAQLMSSRRYVSAEEYNEWKEGMIKLGHAPLFH